MDDICRNVFDGRNPLAIALSKIKPGAQYTIRGYTYEDVEWNSPDITKPTEDELTAAVNAAIAERRIQNTWLPSRVAAYPALDKQLDMLYWDQVNGTTVWMDTIATIKQEFPKAN
jgi:hypothetical protein